MTAVPSHTITSGTTPVVYRMALEIADRLDGLDRDLWAGTLRSCLDAERTKARHLHLQAELLRLSHTTVVRRDPTLRHQVTDTLARLEALLGVRQTAVQPLYAAMRDLVDHLELSGGRRWVARLATVVTDGDRSPETRLERLAVVLAAMTPQAVGVPLGSATLVTAVTGRLGQQRNAAEAVRYLVFATRPPCSSSRVQSGQPAPTNR